jgi:hypothetical protein
MPDVSTGSTIHEMISASALRNLLRLLRAGFGTFRPIDQLEIRSADCGIPDKLAAGS